MSILEKLTEAITGGIPTTIEILSESQFYWVVGYRLAGAYCTAEIIKR
jgi:hypothetical protein